MVSKGNSATTQSYSFDDIHINNIPMNTAQLFYRIQQVDLDGKNSWSSVIAIKIPEQNSVSVYPNPVKKGTLPGVFINEGQKVRAQIYNTSGQLLLEKQLSGAYNILPLKGKVSGLILIKVIYADGRVRTFRVLME